MQKKITTVLIAFFFLHGIVYYFSPTDIINPESPLKWIKYIIVLLLIVVNINRISFGKILILLVVGTCFLIFLFLSNKYLQQDFSLLIGKFIPYFFPLNVYLFTKIFKDVNWKILIRLIFFATTVAGYLEFYVLQGIFREFDLGDDGGVRIVTIFINPNNAGLLIGLMNFFVISSLKLENLKSYFLAATLFVNSAVLIMLTQSKTGMVILVLHTFYIFFIYFKRKQSYVSINKNVLIFLTLSAIIATGLTFLFLAGKSQNHNQEPKREFSLETGEQRLDQIIEFSNDLSENFVFPFFSKKSYTLDNTFVQLWGDASALCFFFLMISIPYTIYILYRRNSKILFPYLIIIASGFSINFLYLWPSAYLFWIFYFLALEMKQGKTD